MFVALDGGEQERGRISREQARMLPVSPSKKSFACSFHVPLPFVPTSAERGCEGLKLPLNGAEPAPSVSMLTPALASSSVVWQKLLPLLLPPPMRLTSVAFV